MPKIQATELHKIVSELLSAAGADERNSERVAEALVSSNLCGVDTHGVFHVPRYINEIKEGTLIPTAWPELDTETPTSALVKGNWTFGHVVAKYSMEIAIEKACGQGISVVSFVRSNHIGRLGEYAEMAADAGMISQIWASGYGVGMPAAVPFGGREPFLHSNPIAIGIPGGDEPAMILDFATTNIANSKVKIAQNRGQEVPPNSLTDQEGNPTTDPSGYPDVGGLMPFGAHKGYSIMLANEFLGRVLSGADGFVEEGRGGAVMRNQGVTMLVMKSDLFQAVSEFGKSSDTLQRGIRGVAPRKGFESVMVPGDLENKARSVRSIDGIPLPEDHWDALIDLGNELGVNII